MKLQLWLYSLNCMWSLVVLLLVYRLFVKCIYKENCNRLIPTVHTIKLKHFISNDKVLIHNNVPLSLSVSVFVCVDLMRNYGGTKAEHIVQLWQNGKEIIEQSRCSVGCWLLSLFLFFIYVIHSSLIYLSKCIYSLLFGANRMICCHCFELLST